MTEIIDPATGNVIEEMTKAGAAETEEAINAAHREARRGGKWRSTGPAERGRMLNRIADLIEERRVEIALAETMNQGKTLSDSELDVDGGAALFRSMASVCGALSGQTFDNDESLHVMTIREPLGACALIVPWNYPFFIACQYAAQILAAGNTLVMKPSEITPLSAVILFDIFEKAGMPAGSVNLVTGSSSTVGEILSHSDKIDKVTFIGSTNVGRKIMTASAESNLKPVTLELGGKSPFIVFDDADMEAALDHGGAAIFLNAGQTCTAGSRFLIQEDIYEEFTERFAELVSGLKVGPGSDRSSKIAPMASRKHMEDVLAYIEAGKAEGARLVCGGKRAEDGALSNGYFIEPTVFADVTEDMKIVREEIFGPVVTIQSFKDEADAIKKANGTVYGLAAGIFTSDGARALRVARSLDAGSIYVNNYHLGVFEAPASAYKLSGIAEELGLEGLKNYTATKQVSISLDVKGAGFFG
jgi:betaine-aldehyde dehydrogenase